MSHHYQLKTLVSELNHAAGDFVAHGHENNSSTTVAQRSQLVCLALSTFVGYRAINPMVLTCFNAEEAIRSDSRNTMKKLVSEVGEAMYLPSQKLLSDADKIYSARWEMFAKPIVSFEQKSVKAFLEAELPGSSDFVYGWLDRGCSVINTYIEECNKAG